nr:stage II sporulation protein M [Lewinella sp. JB7]
MLAQLYVHTTDDLSISRTFYPNRSVRVYLNGLARRTYLHLYRGRRGEAGRFVTFWTTELPLTVHASRRPLLVALAVFVLAMLIGILSYRIDPDFAEMILGADYVRMTEANIAQGDPMAVYAGRDEFGMALHITLNNLSVALLTFVAGAFFCVGTIVLLVRNGVLLGVFQYFFYANGDYGGSEVTTATTTWLFRGLSWLLTAGGGGLEHVLSTLRYLGTGTGVFRESLLTIWIHGTLEISSIVLAGGAGLTLGSGLLFPGTRTRLQAFRRSARAGLKIMLGTVPLFVVAGFLEGYVTRQTDLPDPLRFAIILCCLLFVGWYYLVLPPAVARRAPRARADRQDPLDTVPGERHFQRIRSVGEQLSLTFSVLRSQAGRLLGGAAALSLVYCLLSFAFGGAAEFRYRFVAYPFGDLENFYELLASFGRGRALSFAVLVTLGFYATFRLALSMLFRTTDLTPKPRSRRRELRLLAVCGLLTLSMSFGGAAAALIVFLTFPFLLSLGVSAYLGGSSPGQVFRMVYTNLSASYGLCVLVLLIAFPLTFLVDTVIGAFLFTFLDWVIYTDVTTIDGRNVMLQAFCYYFLLVLVSCTWIVALAFSLGTLREIETATELKKAIAGVGGKRRLRGVERE